MASVLVEQNVPVPMRDGVILRADVYRPATAGPYPALVCRTPYGKDAGYALLQPLRAARAGYVVVLQDTRGRYASEGEFRYFDTLPQEGPDGYDTVEWAATLPDCDGNVGMFGASYLGWTQWSAAMQHPPHLRTIAPMETWRIVGRSVGFRGGALDYGAFLGWHVSMAVDVTRRRLAAAGKSPAEILAAIRRIIDVTDGFAVGGFGAVPICYSQALREAGLEGLVDYALAAGPVAPADWSLNLDAIDIPVLNVGGWYDIFCQDTVDTFAQLRAHGQGRASESRLLMGPWSHSSAQMVSSAIGELDFGVASSTVAIDLMGDLAGVHLRWFDHWLKGIDSGLDREPPARIFVTGENRWRSLPQWPPAGVGERRLYLGAGAMLADTPPAEAAPSTYAYDPRNPAPTLGGNTLLVAVMPPGVKDQRPLSARPDVLTFTGPVLAEPLSVIGQVKARLWVSSSAPDTDFVVRLLDVHPDGYQANLCDGILRMRYREGPDRPVWMEVGAVYRIEVDLWSIAHVFRPGHAVALQVTSSSFPHWDRNWNTREDPLLATGGEVAKQTIWHDGSRPAHVSLPVAPG